MPTVLLTAPYMIPLADRIRLLLAGYGVDLIEAEVSERMGEAEGAQLAPGPAGQYSA